MPLRIVSPGAPLMLLLLSCQAPPPTTMEAASAPSAVAPSAPRGRFVPVGSGFTATLPASGLVVRIDEDGLSATPRAGDTGLSLRLESWGRTDALVPLAPAQVTAAGLAERGRTDRSSVNPSAADRIEADRGALTEWWALSGEAVEHGWTVHAAPSGRGPVRFVLGAAGAEATVVDSVEPGTSVSLTDPTGRIWGYNHLAVFDARGRTLPARFGVEGGDILVEVDDTDAVWPIVIDPLLSSASVTINGEDTMANFGWSLSTAGDINGDGYAETLASAYHLNDYAGRVYVYWGAADAFNTYRPPVLDPDAGSSTAPFFAAVTGGTDFNWDGYSDFAVGGWGYNQSTGRVWVYLGSESPPTTGTALTLDGEAVFSNFGSSLAVAGDVNWDGYADLIVGAYGLNTYTGRVYLYLGSASGLYSTASQTLDGEFTYDNFGQLVAAGGDVNGDGYDDVLISAQGFGSHVGRVYVYHGNASGLDATPATIMDGESENDSFGQAMAIVGDLDGDGYDDAVIGAPVYHAYTGRIYAYMGSAKGLSSTADVVVDGENFNDLFGGVISAAGDIDANGLDEVLVSAVGYDGYRGRVYQLVGTASGLDPSPTIALDGEDLGDYFGYALANIGDVDGDSYGNAMISAPYYDGLTGRAYVYGGYADVDRDGYDSDHDCDDNNADAFPGNTESPGDGVDGDCNGTEECYVDLDADGYRPDDVTIVPSADIDCTGPGEGQDTDPPGDCDDNDPAFNPGIPEIVGDGIDQDCDGVDDCYADADGDGFHSDTTIVTGTDLICDGPGEATARDPGGDCLDSDASVYPGAPEIDADGIDANCDGSEVCFVDADSDGYRPDSGATLTSADGDCSDAGEATSSAPTGDCIDTDAAYHPGADESDCALAFDFNCDGFIRWNDSDGDGAGGCADCNEGDPTVYPGASEHCNGVDEDCDGVIDGPASVDAPTWYADIDRDAYPNESEAVTDCTAPNGYISGENAFDCDDTNAAAHPGAAEIPDDGVDQDCDGADDVTPDTGDTGETDTGDDTGSSIKNKPGDEGKCGCASDASPTPWTAMGVGVGLIVARRRRASLGADGR